MSAVGQVTALPLLGDLVIARNVMRSFGEAPAFRGASLSVARGRDRRRYGPSGSGKSTLLHCLVGIFRPDNGEIWFDSERIDGWAEEARSKLRRRAFGFVSQFGQWCPSSRRPTTSPSLYC